MKITSIEILEHDFLTWTLKGKSLTWETREITTIDAWGRKKIKHWIKVFDTDAQIHEGPCHRVQAKTKDES